MNFHVAIAEKFHVAQKHLEPWAGLGANELRLEPPSLQILLDRLRGVGLQTEFSERGNTEPLTPPSPGSADSMPKQKVKDAVGFGSGSWQGLPDAEVSCQPSEVSDDDEVDPRAFTYSIATNFQSPKLEQRGIQPPAEPHQEQSEAATSRMPQDEISISAKNSDKTSSGDLVLGILACVLALCTSLLSLLARVMLGKKGSRAGKTQQLAVKMTHRVLKLLDEDDDNDAGAEDLELLSITVLGKKSLRLVTTVPKHA